MELPFPLRGLGEATSKARQPPDRSREMRNVVVRDPVTGELRGARRSGLETYSDLPLADGEVQALVSTSWPTPETIEVVLTDQAQSGVTPAEVAATWQSIPVARVVALTIGPREQSYALLETGAVEVRTPDGVLAETIPAFLPAAFEAVRSIEVDERGGVLLAGRAPAVNPEGSGVLWRMARDLTDTWALDWQEFFPDVFERFAYEAGSLAMIVSEPGGAPDDERPFHLIRIAGVLEGVPFEDVRSEVPGPAVDVRLDRRDGAVVGSPPNRRRLVAPLSGFHQRQDSWIPLELRDWQERMYGWHRPMSPKANGALRVNGEPIELLEDQRGIEQGYGEAQPDPRDLARERTLFYDPPVYVTGVGGGAGVARHQEDAVLTSGLADTAASTATLIPGDDTLAWAVSIAWVLRDSATARRLMTHFAGPGNALIRISHGGGVANEVRIETAVGTTILGTTSSTGFALVTMHWDGVDTLQVRFNGTHVAALGPIASMATAGPYPVAAGRNSLGCRTIIGSDRDPARRVNLLQGSSATVTFSGGGGASLVYDNDFSAAGLFMLSVGGSAPYLEVDFGSAITVEELGLWWRDRSSNGVFELSAADDAAHTVNVVTLPLPLADDTPDGAGWRAYYDIRQTFTAPKRYWRFTVTAGQIRVREWLMAQPRDAVKEDPGDGDFLGAVQWLDPTVPAGVSSTGPPGSPVSQVTEAEAVEGFLAHDVGASDDLDATAPYRGVANVPSGVGSVGAPNETLEALKQQAGVVTRWDSRGAMTWFVSGPGYGEAVAVGDEYLVSGGDELAPGPDTHLRRTRVGQQGPEDDPGNWTAVEPDREAALRRTLPLEIDGQGDPFIALEAPDAELYFLARYEARTGSKIWERSLGTTAVQALALGADVQQISPESAQGARYAIVALQAETGPIIQRLELVGDTPSGDTAPRATGVVVVGDGIVDLYDVRSGQQLLAGGSMTLRETGYVAALAAFGEVHLADGETHLVLDPRTRDLREYEPTTRSFGVGAPGLLDLFMGSILMAGFKDPTEWALTAIGDPFNQDVQPVPLVAGRAVLGSASSLGRCPDPVTAVAGLESPGDMALIFTATKTYLLSGHPAQGGIMEPIFKRLGAAYGAPVEFSPDQGTLFWMAHDGTIRAFRFGGQPERISHPWIEKRLRELDLSAVRPILQWSVVEESLRLFLVPRGGVVRGVDSEGSRPPHFLWSAETGAWTELTFGADHLEPRACAALEGTGPDDRVEVIAGADGRLRVWTPNAPNDDGVRIDDSVLMGPFDAGATAMWVALEIDLAVEQGGAVAELYVSDTADDVGRVVSRRVLGPGKNAISLERGAGRFCYVRLHGDGRNRWAYERGSIQAAVKGRRRAIR